ncbi:hypothetical protein KUTeg_018316 [Tegillarca granosa]|uniref:Uncharacterized protein n=1 Tax=Tegillarca granosa TaxID=220873 RepID=A0ABQ9EHJ5_TEGGR|nr:hypothetical protein KUTeg_018316 [Tegillarca granosa]
MEKPARPFSFTGNATSSLTDRCKQVSNDVLFTSTPGQKQRKAKSSTDLHHSSDNDAPLSPPTPSTKRRFWSSFRNKARKFRGKNRNKKDSIDGLSASQPNISSDIGNETQNEYDQLFRESEKRQNELSSDKSFSDPNMSPVHNGPNQSGPKSNPEEQEKADEGDSGIAVVESTTTSVTSLAVLSPLKQIIHNSNTMSRLTRLFSFEYSTVTYNKTLYSKPCKNSLCINSMLSKLHVVALMSVIDLAMATSDELLNNLVVTPIDKLKTRFQALDQSNRIHRSTDSDDSVWEQWEASKDKCCSKM